MSFPQKSGEAVIFQGQASAILVHNRANLISFDPISGEVLTLNHGKQLSVYARISEADDHLHFGTFAGMLSKVIYFIFGVILNALAVTGTYIFGMRVAKIGKSTPKPQSKFCSPLKIICYGVNGFLYSQW